MGFHYSYAQFMHEVRISKSRCHFLMVTTSFHMKFLFHFRPQTLFDGNPHHMSNFKFYMKWQTEGSKTDLPLSNVNISVLPNKKCLFYFNANAPDYHVVFAAQFITGIIKCSYICLKMMRYQILSLQTLFHCGREIIFRKYLLYPNRNQNV